MIFSLNIIFILGFALSRLLIFFCGIYFLMVNWVIFIEWEIIVINSSSVYLSIIIDWIRLIFISFVLLISRIVIIYRAQYISDDKFMNRFILLVIIFVVSMILIIIRPNLIRILLGWDGLGLISYCLVIYYQNLKSYNAGIITAISNRVGDVGLLISIAWILNFGSWNFMFYIEFIAGELNIKIVGLFVLLACITKRAQIPFSSWLPAAIAAPTPVSALVHSSTLVTAGVYLLIRFNLFMLRSNLSQVLFLIGGLTIFMSGLGANFEFDLKKIIALSTLSQLGLIIIILSLGQVKLAFFHLLTHAVFKALLFICAGSVIHRVGNNQDIRYIGGLILIIPITSSFFNIANLSLCGIPFLAGFYSKDLILEISLFLNLNVFLLFFFFFSTGLTVIYSFRLTYYSVVGDFNSIRLNYLDDKWTLILRRKLMLLIITLISGSLLSWLIFPSPMFIILSVGLKSLTLLICLLGALLGYRISNRSLYFDRFMTLNRLVHFFCLIWFMPILSTFILIRLPLLIGISSLKIIDKGWSEFFGVGILSYFIKYLINLYQVAQSNSIKFYILSFLSWFLIYVLLMN